MSLLLLSPRFFRLPLAGVVVLFTALAACVAPLPGEVPPADAILYFPGAMATMPDGRSAYVVSSNFDQRFDAGWLTRIDLDALADALSDKTDASKALRQVLHVPSLGAELQVSAARKRMYLSHRGTGLLSLYDIGAADSQNAGLQSISCGDGNNKAQLSGYARRTDCDAAHLFDARKTMAVRLGVQHAAEREDFDDLASLGVDSNGQLWLGFLGDKHLVAVDDPADASMPSLSTLLEGPQGSTYAHVLPLSDGSLLAAGQLGELMDGRLQDDGPRQALLSHFSAAPTRRTSNYQPARNLGDQRGIIRGTPGLPRICVSPRDNSRVFALSQAPDALLTLALTTEPQSVVQADGSVTQAKSPLQVKLVQAYALTDAKLTDLQYIPRAAGDVLVATSLDKEALYFFDVSLDEVHLLHRIRLPQSHGPYRVLPVLLRGKEALLVSTFFDHGLSIIDISSPSFADFTVTSVHDALFPTRFWAK